MDEIERIIGRVNRTRDLRPALPALTVAARGGDVRARYAIAFCTIKGWGVAADVAAGVASMRRIASGYGPAAFSVGAAYASGEPGVLRSPAKARRWFGVAAELALPDGEYNFAYYLDHGIGGVADPRQAAEWYRRAASHGIADAALNLGNLYFDGRGVRRDRRRAAFWYSRAAEGGSRLAERYLRQI